MTDTQRQYIEGIPTATKLITTFNELYDQGKVHRTDWSTWQQVWSERTKSGLQQQAKEAFL